jgi:DNA repair photolyase
MSSLEKDSGMLLSFPEGNLMPIPSAPEEPKFSGPVSGPMWETVSKLNSAYEETFDWSIYDKLHAKFGKNQPRGGVTFKTTLKMVNHHSQCSKCHYSLEIDTYGRGCVHNCVYCYAKDQLTLRGYWNRPHPMPIDLAEVRKIFHTVFETDKKTKWRPILEQRIPVRIGSMSDSFMWMDNKYGVTREFLEILKFYRYPYMVFTRSDLVAEEKYIQALDKDLAAIQFSMSGENEALTKAIEPGAPNVKRRLKALKTLSEAGFWTTVRINPLLPKYPDGYFTDKASMAERFGEQIPNLPLLDIDQPDGFMQMIKEAGVPTVIAGFVRLNQTAISQLSKASNVDLRKFFKPDLYKSSGESHYTDQEIRQYYRILQESAKRSGLRFTTCYIGNGMKDYYQYQNLWTAKKDCCDALGNVAGIKKTSQAVSWEERHKHSPDKVASEATEKLEKEFDAKADSLNAADVSSVTTELGSVSRIKWAKQKESQPQV